MTAVTLPDHSGGLTQPQRRPPQPHSRAIVRPVDPPQPPCHDELREHCRAHLARFKSPTDWYFTDTLPTRAPAKFRSFRLRKAIADSSLRAGHAGDVAAATCSQRS